MNDTLALLHSHRSDRSFTDEPIADADLDAIVEAGRRAPTSINGQQVSLVVVRDAARRGRLAERPTTVGSTVGPFLVSHIRAR